MAEYSSEEKCLKTQFGDFRLQEVVEYPNHGCSRFYVCNDTALIVDEDICAHKEGEQIFPYSSITSKQNEYMDRYERVFRFLSDDLESVDDWLMHRKELDVEKMKVADRGELAETTPLEQKFEDHFLRIYGKDSTRYLWKEYGVTDDKGSTRFLDYYVQTDTRRIGVEENGVHYHHPQLTGKKQYLEQLKKQNACVEQGIKVFRFSTEDCAFTDRFEDDIRLYFGKSAECFKDKGILVERKFKLYEHQEHVLQDIQEQRAQGIHTFLVVLPTAAGKSLVVEEDIEREKAAGRAKHVLVLAPSCAVVDDWKKRRETYPVALGDAEIMTNQAMQLRYTNYPRDRYDYIIVDEAHHAVAPETRRMIQYFHPDFLIGLTATDERLDKKRLEDVFGNYRVEMSLKEAMEKGVVAMARAFRIESNLDLSKVRINGHEYVNADLEKSIRVTSRNELIADVLVHYFSEGEDAKRQGLVFCVGVQHAEEMAKCLRAVGFTASSYTGKSKHPEKIMQDFRDKKIRFLCTCSMISEGWDYPELGILVMARPTLSKVLYTQQLGRGLRKTSSKKDVYVLDMVDEYGMMAQPCSLHSILQVPWYVPFGDVVGRTYQPGDMVVVNGLVEHVEKIVELDLNTFDEKYGDWLSKEQVARELFVSTGTVTDWLRKGKITCDVTFPFGNYKIELFKPERVEEIRKNLGLAVHDETTIKKDFFNFLKERDYSLSYKMPFLLAVLKNMDASGDVPISDVLRDYRQFYQDRIDHGLVVDRKTCPYTEKTLKDDTFLQRNMLMNPFEKFERKRFLYYSKDLGVLSMNHALHEQLEESDYKRIEKQMREDLRAYYAALGEKQS